MLHSWLDRLLVLLALSTAVLTLFALQYVVQPLAPAQSTATAQLPRDPGAGFAQTGMNALQAGDPATAIRWFERAAQASPRNPEWHRRLADAYRQSGDAGRANEEEQRAMEIGAAQAAPGAAQ